MKKVFVPHKAAEKDITIDLKKCDNRDWTQQAQEEDQQWDSVNVPSNEDCESRNQLLH